MNRPTWYLRALLLITSTLVSGCLEFESIEQPSSVLPGELFTVRIAATTGGGDVAPYFGICLPLGWTIPADAIACTGVYQETIRYDPNLSLEQEALSPPPQGYYWWVGDGNSVETPEGNAFAEVSIQTGLQTGRYALDFLLTTAPHEAGGGLLDAQRSNNHIVDIVNELTPRELNSVVQGNSVVLTWRPPMRSEGLAGYRVYRDGKLIYTGPAQIAEVLDEDMAGGVFRYSASALYGDADEQLTPYEVRALIFSGGTGEPNDPYQLGMADQFVCLAENPGLLDKAFLLVQDINLDPNQWGKSAFGEAVIPVFSGIFDGGGYVVSHLVIHGGQNLGLFGILMNGAEVRNIGVVDANIAGSAGFVGGLVGYSEGSIATSYSSGSVSGTRWFVGGLAGHNAGSIATSYSIAMVHGTDEVGGLAGSNGARILRYGNNGVSLGSLSQYGSSDGRIINSYSSGSVSGESDVGGLVGSNGGTMTQCYSTGAVSGSTAVGGLVGINTGSRDDAGYVIRCYSTGAVTGKENVGGLVGSGYGEAVITASFWDIETSGHATSAGGTGRTTAEMQTASTFLDTGWDFVDETANGTCDYWQISPGDYPRLHYQDGSRPLMPEGLGTAEQPYLIRDARDLGTVWLEPLAHYRLAQSVDLSGITWSTAVIPGFGGSFDGNGYAINHLHIQGGRYLGLFGHLDASASISNLGLDAVEVRGTDYLGGLAGYNEGSIATGYSTGSVSGQYNVGGLVGYNEGSIATSYSTGSISGESNVSGLVGNNWGSISSSYSTGSISGTMDVGGLVGKNHGSIVTSYSSGSVGGTESSVGGLVGDNWGSIALSHSSSSVDGDEDVGGLVGWNDGDIVAVRSTGSVNGTNHIGGLVGWNGADIVASYSRSSVNGTGWYVGGLVGYNYLGSIVTSYSSGLVSSTRSGVGGLIGINDGSINSSFWDIQTSGRTTSAGGTGKTTAEMQTAKTFLDGGWDFVGETTNGTEDIWWILEGKDYPRLWWELPAAK